MPKVIVKSGEGFFQPDPGVHLVQIIGIEEIETAYGLAFRVKVEGPKWNGETWGFVVSPRCSPRSKLGQLMIAAGVDLEKLIGKEVDVKDLLLGKQVHILVDKRGDWSRPVSFFSSKEAPF